MDKNILSTEDANNLMRLHKIVESNDSVVRFSFKPDDTSVAFSLVSTENPKEEHFRLFIKKSKKKTAKVTLHHMHNETLQCLLRVDINGAHQNPRLADERVPEKFHPHAGKMLRASHVHYYIEGYEDFWALPLNETDFKEWTHIDNIENSLQGILDKFRGIINLSTAVIYDSALPL